MAYGFFTIFWRDMIRFVRFKTLLVSSLLQPALWMAFFGIAMSSNFDKLTAGLPVPAGAHVVGYLTFMGAGIIAMTTLFTSLFSGIVILFDKNWGLMREILASPTDRNQIILGIALSGVTKSFIQAVIIMAFGIAIGAAFFAGFTPVQTAIGVAGILAFVALFALGFLFLSAAIAISMESPEGLQGIMTLLTMPIFFASNALYPIDTFPEILKIISIYNPLTLLINGIRYFAIGPDFVAMGKHYAITQGDVLLSFAGLIVFAAIMFAFAYWRFGKAVVT
ncbi:MULTISPECIES: ABC transporter permease [unclassified Methanoregula]|uniref:ABC transporter permease n=1 Tax=unclassified Methanoregula TaxID=2649730 RepID=UPI0009CE6D00|nr:MULTISPECIES: ABC transporter permease [unclassified Methanoregula]OPX63928.1 MAG: ABC-2 type transporter [Methanoregula sp. PtaB.Bin085]OPY35480.1 MAG: ABC-2 type transporter [Methanoregula sp. PtaU1.Bin006]